MPALATITRNLAPLYRDFAHGVILVDRNRQVVDANAYAEQVLAATDGISAADGRLRAADPLVTRLLERHVRAAIAGPPGLAALRLRRPTGRRDLEILVRGLDDPRAPNDRALAAVLVSDPERARVTGTLPKLLADLYGLTPAEAWIAADLALGRSPQEIAARRRIRAGTVRVHLKSIFAKTGTARQAELVQRILRSPLAVIAWD